MKAAELLPRFFVLDIRGYIPYNVYGRERNKEMPTISYF